MKKVAMLFGLFVLIFVASLGFVSAYETYSVSNEQLNEGYTSPLIKNGDTLTFSIDEQARKIMLSSVVRGQVLLSITPLDDMQYVSSGEEKKYELTGDNSYDISIRLEEAQWSEYFGQENATIFIKRINEDVPEGTILPRSCIYKYYECPDGKKIYNCGYSGTGVVVARYNQVNVKKKRQMIHLVIIIIGSTMQTKNVLKNNSAERLCMKDCRLLRRREHVKKL